MTIKEAPPALLTTGTWGELREQIHTDHTVDWVFMPALIAVILHFHQKQDGILSQEEVERIRDNAAVIALPKGSHEKQAEARGYSDILSPEHVWIEYLYAIGAMPEGNDGSVLQA